MTAGGPSMAQQPPAPPRGQTPDPAKMIAQKTSDIAMLLGLRSEQRPALEVMLSATTPPPPARGKEMEAGGKPDDWQQASTKSFTEHLAQRERDASQRAEAERARVTALRTFYLQLDIGQQQRFEALMRLSHGFDGGFGPPPPGGPNGPDFRRRPFQP